MNNPLDKAALVFLFTGPIIAQFLGFRGYTWLTFGLCGLWLGMIYWFLWLSLR